MTLIARVSRLFKADLHAVLDRVEEPDLVLRQAIREMEEDLAGDRRRMAALRSELQQSEQRDTDIERSLARIAEDLDICFEAGKEDLSRVLLRRRLEAQALRAVLARRRAALTENLARIERRVAEHGSKLEAMRQKAELLAPEEEETAAASTWNAPDLRVPDADVEVAFLREKQRRAQS